MEGSGPGSGAGFGSGSLQIIQIRIMEAHKQSRVFSFFAFWWKDPDPDLDPDSDRDPYKLYRSGSWRPINLRIRIRNTDNSIVIDFRILPKGGAAALPTSSSIPPLPPAPSLPIPSLPVPSLPVPSLPVPSLPVPVFSYDHDTEEADSGGVKRRQRNQGPPGFLNRLSGHFQAKKT